MAMHNEKSVDHVFYRLKKTQPAINRLLPAKRVTVTSTRTHCLLSEKYQTSRFLSARGGDTFYALHSCFAPAGQPPRTPVSARRTTDY